MRALPRTFCTFLDKACLQRLAVPSILCLQREQFFYRRFAFHFGKRILKLIGYRRSLKLNTDVKFRRDAPIAQRYFNRSTLMYCCWRCWGHCRSLIYLTKVGGLIEPYSVWIIELKKKKKKIEEIRYHAIIEMESYRAHHIDSLLRLNPG